MPILCALSGIAATPEESEEASAYSDDAPGLPVDWVEVKITRRRSNPRWETLQAVKVNALKQYLAQIPKADRKNARPFVAVQVDASFAALEAQEEYAETLVDTETVYIAPVDRVEGLGAAVAQFAALIGVPVDLFASAGVEGDDGAESDGAEPADDAGGVPVEGEAAGA
jgi:hypothetical protein